jgi:large subunit ribosomal protein L30
LLTVSDKKTIRIKWVRSGIGFTYRQKSIVRSLGLNKLNHTVVRPDTPQIRGIVASVPHLLEIVAEPVAPAWASIPEYTIQAPEKPKDVPAAPKPAAATAKSEPEAEPPKKAVSKKAPAKAAKPAAAKAKSEEEAPAKPRRKKATKTGKE